MQGHAKDRDREGCNEPDDAMVFGDGIEAAQTPGGQEHRPRRQDQEGPAQPAFAPADVIGLFARHLSQGSLDQAMALYEPEATYLTATGERLRGRQIRQAFQRLAALRPQMRGTMDKVIEAGDVALVNNRWQFSGQRPDGQQVRSSGISAVVLRRRTDGSWGILIDDPWGVTEAR